MQDPSNIVHVEFGNSSRISTESHARKSDSKERFLFWFMLVYMAAIVSVVLVMAVFLLLSVAGLF